MDERVPYKYGHEETHVKNHHIRGATEAALPRREQNDFFCVAVRRGLAHLGITCRDRQMHIWRLSKFKNGIGHQTASK